MNKDKYIGLGDLLKYIIDIDKKEKSIFRKPTTYEILNRDEILDALNKFVCCEEEFSISGFQQIKQSLIDHETK